MYAVRPPFIEVPVSCRGLVLTRLIYNHYNQIGLWPERPDFATVHLSPFVSDPLG
jgi:hypothetical protein